MTGSGGAPRAVVVSPHLDDAVLSCGGLLAEVTGHVITVFCGVPPAGTAAPMWDLLTGATDSVRRMHERLAEDDRALAVLGTTTERLGLLDGQYRSGPVAHGELVARLRPLLAGATEVHVPAAIGSHPDHVATREAALAAADAAADVLLYADLPYALSFGWPSWVDGRRPEPLLDPGQWLAGELAGAGVDLATLTAVPRALTEAATARKRAAVAAYASQLPALDALAGGRLTEDHASRFELAWRVARGPAATAPASHVCG